MSASREAIRDYRHRLDGRDSSFFTGENVLESMVQTNDLREDQFERIEWYDEFSALRTEVNNTDAFGSVAVHHWTEKNGEKTPRSFNSSFSESEDYNEIFGEDITAEQILDVESMEIKDSSLEVGTGILDPEVEDVSIRPEYVFGVVVYGTPLRAQELGDEMSDSIHPDHSDYLENGMPGKSLGRIRTYVEGNTSVIGIGYTPAEADYEDFQGTV